MDKLVSINGEIFDFKDAKVSAFDRGFLFGDAVYEVTRSYDKVFFQIEKHVDRLLNSADRIAMDIGQDHEDLIKEIYETYKKIDKPDYYVRIQISRGAGPIGMDPDLAEGITKVLYFQPFPGHDEYVYSKGVPVHVTPRLRNSKKAMDPNIKSGNYLNNVLAFIEGKKHGAYETFMMNSEDKITEGCTSNIFIVNDGEIRTQPDDDDILRGITRSLVFEVAQSQGIPVRKASFTLEDLINCDEAFLTSSTREIVPISVVNGQQISFRTDEVVKKLRIGYSEIVENYCKWARVNHPWN